MGARCGEAGAAVGGAQGTLHPAPLFLPSSPILIPPLPLRWRSGQRRTCVRGARCGRRTYVCPSRGLQRACRASRPTFAPLRSRRPSWATRGMVWRLFRASTHRAPHMTARCPATLPNRVAHAGNFHVFFLLDESKPEELEEAIRLNRRMVHRAIDMNGTCVARKTRGHTCGLLLTLRHTAALESMAWVSARRWEGSSGPAAVAGRPRLSPPCPPQEFLARELGEPNVALMRRLKATLDPLNIMNPGKLVPEKRPPAVVATSGGLRPGWARRGQCC